MYPRFLTPDVLKFTISPNPIENIIPEIVKTVDAKKPSGRTSQTELANNVSSNIDNTLTAIFFIA
ncbi:hypothetical protein EsCd1HHP049_01122 [Escherichia sp. HH154_1D]|nr:hypothetical protein EsCdI10290_01159 [Escherichia sp. 10290]BDI45491.1 hypothetical protein EsCd1HHP049_01122 [Escherichia sp. HH154_1D]